MTFSDRIKMVAGPHPFAWAEDHGFSKSTMQSLLICSTPQTKTLQKLVSVTGIPVEWWLHGEGEPPARKAQQDVVRYDAKVSAGGVDTVSLAKILSIVDETLNDLSIDISNERKAELSAMIYDYLVKTGHIDPNYVERLIRLVR